MFDWFKKKKDEKKNAALAKKVSGAGTKVAAKPKAAKTLMAKPKNVKKTTKKAVTTPKKPAKAEKKANKSEKKPRVQDEKNVEKPTLKEAPKEALKPVENNVPATKEAPILPATMQQPADQKEIKEKLREGWTRCLITFELAGKPKEHIDNTLKAYIDNVKLDPRIRAVKEEFAEALEHEDGIFSAFCELEAIVQDLETLTWLAINFLPASIEVIAPEKREIEARHVTNWYNDLLAKLHETSNLIREERSITSHLTESLNALIKNSIKAALQSGAKSPVELERMLGISAAQLAPFLKHLVEKGHVKQDGETYSL